jgi:WD40 repeat protein
MTNVYSWAVYSDGKRLIVVVGPVCKDITGDVESEPSVSVGDIDKGRQIFQIGTNALPVLRFCLSPDGRTLYSCGDKVRAWNATKPRPPIHESDAHGRPMISVAISPDGNMLAADGRDGTGVIWHTEAGARVGTLAHDAGPVYGLAFSPTSTKLAAAGERGVGTVWSVELHSAKKEYVGEGAADRFGGTSSKGVK